MTNHRIIAQSVIKNFRGKCKTYRLSKLKIVIAWYQMISALNLMHGCVLCSNDRIRHIALRDCSTVSSIQ